MKPQSQKIVRTQVRLGIASAVIAAGMISWAPIDSAAGQELSLPPAPLILDDLPLVSSEQAPRKLAVLEASAMLSGPAMLAIPPTPPQFYTSTPEAPSIVSEMVGHQDDATAPSQVNTPTVTVAPSAPRSTATVWKLRSIDEITFHHPPAGATPDDRSAELFTNAPMPVSPQVNDTVFWVAPNLYYQPLLFEDARLERYGRGADIWGLQPALSGVHFAVDGAMMPFRAFKYRCEWETPLAFERPGSCTQPTKEIVFPWN